MLYREIIAVCSQIHTEHINTICEKNVGFLGSFAKLQKATYLCRVCLSVHLQQLGSHWKDVHNISTVRQSVEKIQVSLKCDQNSGTLHEDRYMYICDNI
jgi:hypothetical protein